MNQTFSSSKERRISGTPQSITPTLPIDDMHTRHHGLTEAIAQSYHEAARVCLDRHHSSPIDVDIEDVFSPQRADLRWTVTDQRTRNAWANQIDTTEAGAYAMVIAGVELARGHFAVRRAETGSGADYYVGPPTAGADDLEDCLRLEVSGVDGGDRKTLENRLTDKVSQAAAGNGALPAMAGVVGFRLRCILLADVPEPA